MPANVTHMLIAHKALQTLKGKGVDEFAEFAEMLDDTSGNKNYKAYFNLGSLGPDLYYYSKISSSIADMLQDGFVQAKGVKLWSYHLHSHSPNKFLLKLIEIIFSDVIREKGEVKPNDDDIRKLAYIAGHLTHIAADQVIHPIVNSIAGPCYRSGENWKKHRKCEVFQDYFLYEEVYRLEGKSGPKYEFLKQAFHNWIECVSRAPSSKERFGYLLERGLLLKWSIWSLIRYLIGYLRVTTFQSTEEWFQDFLQRGFVETYDGCPSKEEIKDSVDYLRLMLLACQKFGPYRKADKEYKQNRDGSAMYQEYIKDVNYIKYYRLAVELAVIYLIALYEVYFVLREGRDFTDKQKKRFLKIVSDADLSCPLKMMILEKALYELRNKISIGTGIRTHTSGLLEKTEFLTPSRIFEIENDRDIVQA
jgi:hypothetical protein